jgi:hypothetical protein
MTFHRAALGPVEILKVLCRRVLKNFTAKFKLFKLESFASWREQESYLANQSSRTGAIRERKWGGGGGADVLPMTLFAHSVKLKFPCN